MNEALVEYARLTTKVVLKSRYRPDYAHPVGSDATFLEEQPCALLLIEVHAPDPTLVGHFWHEVFEVPSSDVNAVDDGAQSGACITCGLDKHDDGSRVTWRCGQCGQRVCRGCTLTIPNRKPPEYYHQTLCGTDCWRKAGMPME